MTEEVYKALSDAREKLRELLNENGVDFNGK
jgi:hypothetical protein